MKKARTRKNIFTILNAIIGVVFAFAIGITYCATSLTWIYSSNPNSTSAYLGNQQYYIVNDTLENPVVFSEGSHNFEIALQYAFDYNFDVRLTYSMAWSGGGDISNVILHFANRDNIIYDEQYIFLANKVTANNGKITIITGVDFVSTSQDSTYVGQTLQITISEVKIYREQSSYDLTNHLFTKDIQTSDAAQAWIYYKNKGTSASSYVMMYNYRRNYDNGVSYPGLETAYKKQINSSKEVSDSAWAGGNTAYAGTGMYVITGTTAVTLSVKVKGIWRSKTGTTITDIEDRSLISENSVQYNYTSNWTHSSWDDIKLWETRTFNYYIPASSAYYIEILDSIEITSAGLVASNLYDSYRLVTNSITINPDATSPIAFEYTEANAEYVQLATITTNSNVTASKSYSDVDKSITVVNKSLYSNGLYNAYADSSAEQTFKTNISLINNTAETQIVTIAYQLWYHISNSNFLLTEENTVLRAEELSESKTDGKVDNVKAFNNSKTLFYSCSLQCDESRLTSTMTTSVVIAPYSSVNVADSYMVSADLQSDVSTKFDVSSTDDVTDNYDVWTYLIVTTSSKTSTSSNNLAIETQQSGNTLSLLVKNNTNKTITGVSVSSVSVLEVSTTYTQEGGKPKDWSASYWKYATRSGEVGSYTFTTLTNNSTPTTSFYKKAKVYSTVTLTKAGEFTVSGTTFTDTSVILNPGETTVFATATINSAGTQVTTQVSEKTTKTEIYSGTALVSGLATATRMSDPSDLLLINSGKSSAYLINYGTSSYFVKLSGDFAGTNSNIYSASDGNYYYIGVIRPGQILDVSGIDACKEVSATGTYSASTLTSAGWDATAVAKLTKYFALIKT